MYKRARRPGVRGVAAAIALGATLLACTPVFDWREARPEGSGVAMLFPCRPAKQERSVRIGGVVMPMQLHSCSAGGATFLLDAVDVGDPALVTPTLAAFRTQAAVNLSGAATGQRAFDPPGATPNPQSGRVGILGKRPDGRPVVAQTVYFVKGLRLYQATVLGAVEPAAREAVDTFFGAIRVS